MLVMTTIDRFFSHLGVLQPLTGDDLHRVGGHAWHVDLDLPIVQRGDRSVHAAQSLLKGHGALPLEIIRIRVKNVQKGAKSEYVLQIVC